MEFYDKQLTPDNIRRRLNVTRPAYEGYVRFRLRQDHYNLIQDVAVGNSVQFDVRGVDRERNRGYVLQFNARQRVNEEGIRYEIEGEWVQFVRDRGLQTGQWVRLRWLVNPYEIHLWVLNPFTGLPPTRWVRTPTAQPEAPGGPGRLPWGSGPRDNRHGFLSVVLRGMNRNNNGDPSTSEDDSKAMEALNATPHLDLHEGFCRLLFNIYCNVWNVSSALEASCSRSRSGIQACSLHVALEKARNLLQHCSECSKLYLVHEVVRELEETTFSFDTSEKQVGDDIIVLLQQGRKFDDSSSDSSELETFHIAACKHITSSWAALAERSLKKLIEKARIEEDKQKESIVAYLLHLMWKYSKLFRSDLGDDQDSQGCGPCSPTKEMGLYTASKINSEFFWFEIDSDIDPLFKHHMAGLAAIEIAQKVSRAWRALQAELKNSGRGTGEYGRRAQRKESGNMSSQNRGGPCCSTSSSPDISESYGLLEDRSTAQAMMSWQDEYSFPIKWRQISEPCDPVVWINKLRKIIDRLVNYLMGDMKDKLIFSWDLSYCTQSNFTTLESKHKALVFKELRKVWESYDPDLPWEKGEYNDYITVLLDDTPYKALLNPPHTAILLYLFDFKDRTDDAIGPDGNIRAYLEEVAMAHNVQEYLEQNPFDQGAIKYQ